MSYRIDIISLFYKYRDLLCINLRWLVARAQMMTSNTYNVKHTIGPKKKKYTNLHMSKANFLVLIY